MKYKLETFEKSKSIIYLFDNETSVIADCHLVHIQLDDWLNDLSLWKTEKYAGNARETLNQLTQVIKEVEKGLDIEKRYIAGYSLGGLFSLYAYLETDLFYGCASVSGSLWYPGFKEYITSKSIRDGKIYLSLGDQEEFTKFKEMKCVGDHTRYIYSFLKDRVSHCIYQVNPGGHFDQIDQRVLKGIQWILKGEE